MNSIQAPIGVGKEILSYCNKCSLALAHIIETMKTETTPDKVQCKTCKASHKYKSPTAPKKKAVRKTRASSKQAANLDLWIQKVEKSKQEFKDYSPRGQFDIGDVLDHKTFGPGLVERRIDGNKIEVLFREGMKILMAKGN